MGGLATAVSVLLGFAALASLVYAFPYFDRGDVLDALRDRPLPPLMVNVVDNAGEAVARWLIIPLVLSVATGIVFILWQHRHATNAVALGGQLSLGPGWAIAGWFLPVANLVVPFRQLSQSARATGRVPVVQVVWTGTFVAAAVAFAASFSYRDDAVAATDLRAALARLALADRLAGAALLLFAVAGVFAILTVCTLTRRQHNAIAQATRDSLST